MAEMIEVTDISDVTVAALSSPPSAGTPYSITVAKPGASKVLRPFAEVTES